MKYTKSQAALEFLTTYGWVFLVILITVGVMFQFGILDFDRFLPQKCEFTSQFPCLDYTMTVDTIDVKVQNALGEDVIIIDSSITNDASTPLVCDDLPTDSGQINFDADEEEDLQFTNCHDGGLTQGDRTDIELSFTFFAPNTPGNPQHIIRGKISGIIR